jgi:hypothetical protein
MKIFFKVIREEVSSSRKLTEEVSNIFSNKRDKE